jgi:hypothetical protein
MAKQVPSSAIQATMMGLGHVIRDIDPDDSRVFGYMEAYANLWLLDLEDDVAPSLDIDVAASARVVPFPRDRPRARAIRGRAPVLAG